VSFEETGAAPEGGGKLWPDAGTSRNGLLLLALAAFIILLPFIKAGGVGEFVVRLGFAAIVAAGIYIASERRGVFLVAALLAIPVLVVDWGTTYRDDTPLMVLRSGLSASFVFFTAGIQILHLGRERQVTTDTILGSVNIYLLLIVAFMFLHTMLEVGDPGAYRIGEQSLGEYLRDPSVNDSMATSTLIYFSITTFTTLGYGDIVPVSSAARVITGFEAIVGQLYVAIVVARLVALQIGQSRAGAE
jgi:hypothetical protein